MVGVGLVVGIGLHMSILRDVVMMVSSGVVLPSPMVAMVSVGKPLGDIRCWFSAGFAWGRVF